MLPTFSGRTVLSNENIEALLSDLLQQMSELRSIVGQAMVGSGRAPESLQRDLAESSIFRAAQPPLPDPRLVRHIIRRRQLRSRFFDAELFSDPAWDILLDLTAARAEHSRVSVTSLCIASGVPPTTALRWISQMVEMGLLNRVEDDTDRRRAFIELSDKAASSIAQYFAELGRDERILI